MEEYPAQSNLFQTQPRELFDETLFLSFQSHYNKYVSYFCPTWSFPFYGSARIVQRVIPDPTFLKRSDYFPISITIPVRKGVFSCLIILYPLAFVGRCLLLSPERANFWAVPAGPTVRPYLQYSGTSSLVCSRPLKLFPTRDVQSPFCDL